MTEVKFYRGAINILTVQATDASYVSRSVMGECTAYLEFMRDEPAELVAGDYCTLHGDRYIIEDVPLPFRDVARLKYQVKLKGTVHELEKAVFFITDSTTLDDTSKTSWNCTPLQLLSAVVDNLERLQPSAGWQLFECIIAPAKTIELNNNTCLEVLRMAAEAWDIHYDVTQFKLSLLKIDSLEAYTLGVGKGLGLREITANRSNNTPVYTKVYAFGSNKNNPLGQRLTIPPVVWPGASVIIETVQEFDDIFPQIVVTVKSIIHMIYDVTLRTDAIGFDIVDYMIPGQNPRITFLSGQLKGMSFNLWWYGQDTFAPIPYRPDPSNQSLVIPGATGYNPVAGDTFEICGIDMPLLYVNEAKARLEAAALAFLAKSQAKLKLNLTCDEIEFRRSIIDVGCGMKLRLISDIIPQLYTPGVAAEVLSYRRSITQPWKYDQLIVGDVLLTRAFENRVEKVIERTILKQTEIITGISDKEYVHNQVEASAEWTVKHNLDKYPAVSVTGDDLSTRDAQVTYLSPNTIKINFSVPAIGLAICN